MKRLFILVSACFILFACSNSGSDTATKDSTEKAKAAGEEQKPAPSITYPYTANYSSDFKMGDPAHSKVVLDLWKLWDQGKVDEMRPMFADSVELIFADGTHFKKNTGDSLINFVRAYRGSLKSVTSKVDGWMPMHSNDRNSDFVLIWGREIRTNAKGVTDSTDLHEIWIFNKGKVEMVFQYEEKIPKD